MSGEVDKSETCAAFIFFDFRKLNIRRARHELGLQPSLRANSTPFALVTVICVEAWIGKNPARVRGSICKCQRLERLPRPTPDENEWARRYFFRVGQFRFQKRAC